MAIGLDTSLLNVVSRWPTMEPCSAIMTKRQVCARAAFACSLRPKRLPSAMALIRPAQARNRGRSGGPQRGYILTVRCLPIRSPLFYSSFGREGGERGGKKNPGSFVYPGPGESRSSPASFPGGARNRTETPGIENFARFPERVFEKCSRTLPSPHGIPPRERSARRGEERGGGDRRTEKRFRLPGYTGSVRGFPSRPPHPGGKRRPPERDFQAAGHLSGFG
jgi:hypothetical protein